MPETLKVNPEKNITTEPKVKSRNLLLDGLDLS
jgi:hypothetical protein